MKTSSSSERRHDDKVAIARQLRIARAHGSLGSELRTEPGRLRKHHAMDCGTPGCTLCGNPRRNRRLKTHEQLTVQELRAIAASKELVFEEEGTATAVEDGEPPEQRDQR